MFTQFRHGVAERRQRLSQDVARTRAQAQRARDEYHLSRAERPRSVSRLADLVARFHGVTLYRDHIERAGQTHSLVGVRAEVSEIESEHPEYGHVREVYLIITGPDWKWSVRTAAMYSSRKVDAFASVINSQAAVVRRSAPRAATSTGQFRVLSDLRGSGVLTDDEFATALQRVGTGRP
ncbi:MAG TPA: hypothetical protein VGH99_22650 [Pseudonocardia sp.]|jgi:hypothetical protein